MTLILDLDLHIMKMDMHAKNKFVWASAFKVRARRLETQRQTDTRQMRPNALPHRNRGWYYRDYCDFLVLGAVDKYSYLLT